jgi:hypothetical protein
LPAIGKKSLPVNEDTHRKIAMESASTGVDMYALVDQAWAAYTDSIARKGQTGLPETVNKTNLPIGDGKNPATVDMLEVLRVLKEVHAASSETLKSVRALQQHEKGHANKQTTEDIIREGVAILRKANRTFRKPRVRPGTGSGKGQRGAA